MSVSIRHPSDKSSAVTSFETDMFTSQMQQETRYIRGILMRVASGLFCWSMAAGLLAFSSRQFALTINHEPLSASHYFSFLSKGSGWRMPPAERSALYIRMNYIHAYIHTYKDVPGGLEEWHKNSPSS